MNKSNNNILLIASAGGHLTQALCAISQCEKVILCTNSKDFSDHRVKKILGIIDTQFNYFYHFLNVFIAMYYILKYKPKSIISTGGPIALGFGVASRILRTNFVYLDTLSRVQELSNTASFIHKHKLADDMYCQWEAMAKEKNLKYIGKCFDILNENVDDSASYHTTDTPTVFVTLGTNDYKFDRLLERISKLSIYQDERVKWIIQTGKSTLTNPPANYEVYDLLPRDQVGGIVKDASLVVSHCGIGSIHLVLSYSKKTMFFPRVAEHNEFSDDHQLQIANEIRNVNFDVIFPEDEFTDITYEELCQYRIYDEERDIINQDFALKFKDILTS
ncbi:glycosyltransferase [Vibrio sp. RC27]